MPKASRINNLGWLTGSNSATGHKCVSVLLANQQSASGRKAEVRRPRAKRSRKVSDGPPPLENGSPTLAGNKREANREKSQRKNNTKAETKPQDAERHFFWIASGQVNLGFVEQVDETYKAISADERDLGTFGSLKAAADAVSANFAGAA